MYQIWYRAMTTYYTQAENFNGAYFKLIQACEDLYQNELGTCTQFAVLFRQ